MARIQVPFEYFDGPNAKKYWSPRELDTAAVPSLEEQAIALEEERTAERARKRAHTARLRLAKEVLSLGQYRVFQLLLAGLEDAEIAQSLSISVASVQTFRSECKKKLNEAESSGNSGKKRGKRKERS